MKIWCQAANPLLLSRLNMRYEGVVLFIVRITNYLAVLFYFPSKYYVFWGLTSQISLFCYFLVELSPTFWSTIWHHSQLITWALSILAHFETSECSIKSFPLHLQHPPVPPNRRQKGGGSRQFVRLIRAWLHNPNGSRRQVMAWSTTWMQSVMLYIVCSWDGWSLRIPSSFLFVSQLYSVQLICFCQT